MRSIGLKVSAKFQTCAIAIEVMGGGHEGAVHRVSDASVANRAQKTLCNELGTFWAPRLPKPNAD